MRRALKWVFANVGEISLLIMMSLFSIVMSFTATVLDLINGVGIFELIPIFLLASLSGWYVGKRQYAPSTAILIGIGSGVLVILAFIGRLLTPLLKLLWAFVEFASQATQLRWMGTPDSALLQRAAVSFIHGVEVVFVRIINWISGLLSGELTYDLVAVGLAWSMLFWIIIFWIVWSYRKWQRPLLTVFPPGAILGAALAFTLAPPNRILPFLAAAFFLFLFTRIDELRSQWEADQVDYPSEVWFDIGGSGVFLIAILLGLAVGIPSIEWDNFATFFRTDQTASSGLNDGLPSAIGLERGSLENDNFQRLRYGGLPREHLIGSGPDLDERVVMSVKVSQNPPIEGVSEPLATQPFYWRSLTFERYTGSGWANGPTQNLKYSGSDIQLENIPPGFQGVRQDFQYFENQGGLLHVAGQVRLVDEDYEIAWRSQPASGPETDDTPVEQFGDIFGVIVESNTYRAQAFLPRVSEETLLVAGIAYPRAIRDRYLLLPEDLPPRVLALARDLTATLPTPYERALAIEAHLRTIPYNLDLPAPPPNRDVVDYFLFDLQTGYCDYYASAMVVLARASGLPARLVMGYASGDFDDGQKIFHVTEADAHSWAEVYFPGSGWIEFEPTAGLSAISRPSALINQDDDSNLADPSDRRRVETILSRFLNNLVGRTGLWLGGGLMLFAAGFMFLLGGPFLQVWGFRKKPPDEAIHGLFQILYDEGRTLRVPIVPGLTAYEFEAALRERLLDLARVVNWRGDLAAPFSDLQLITELFAWSLFSRKATSPHEINRVIRSWLRLRRTIRRARLWQWRASRGLFLGEDSN